MNKVIIYNKPNHVFNTYCNRQQHHNYRKENMKINKEQDETLTEKLKKKMFSLTEDSASHEEIRTRLLDGGQVTGTNMCVLVCAMIIASVGLNMSSTAVIIGAMLISPLMGSILASAYASVSADYSLLRKHAL